MTESKIKLVADYGQIRDRNATEHELEVFNALVSMTGEQLELVRVSKDYVSARLGDWDVARIKYSPRAHWVMFPTAEAKQQKHHIDDPEQVREFADLVDKSLEIIRKFSN